MIGISLSLNEAQFKHAREALLHIPKGAEKAIARAINRALEGARTDAVKSICQEYHVKPTEVRRTFQIVRARPDKLEAQIISSGGAIPLIKFKVSPKSPAKQNKKRIADRKRLVAGVRFGTNESMPFSFVIRAKNGYTGVFSRVGDRSLPLKQRYGPAVPQMLGHEKVLRFIEQGAQERLDKELQHQINYLFGGGK